jgi:hypothetical protein
MRASIRVAAPPQKPSRFSAVAHHGRHRHARLRGSIGPPGWRWRRGRPTRIAWPPGTTFGWNALGRTFCCPINRSAGAISCSVSWTNAAPVSVSGPRAFSANTCRPRLSSVGLAGNGDHRKRNPLRARLRGRVFRGFFHRPARKSRSGSARPGHAPAQHLRLHLFVLGGWRAGGSGNGECRSLAALAHARRG